MRPAPQAPVVIPPATWHESIAALKRALIAEALRRSGGNRTRVAEALGLQRTYLLRLMREMGMTEPRQLRQEVQPCPTETAPAAPARTAR